MSHLTFAPAYALSYDIIHPWHREPVVKYFKEENDVHKFITDNNLKVSNSYPMNRLKISRVTILQHGKDMYNLGTPINLEYN